MFYFKQRGDARPAGCIPLRSVRCHAVQYKGKEFVFEVIAPKISKGECARLVRVRRLTALRLVRARAVFNIQATSKHEMETWMKAIDLGSDYSNVSSPFNLEHRVHMGRGGAGAFVVASRVMSTCVCVCVCVCVCMFCACQVPALQTSGGLPARLQARSLCVLRRVRR
jgi:hypothetical protein